MNTHMRVLATLSLVLASGQAVAIPTLRTVQPTFNQTGSNGGVNAGLVVEASTDLLVLAIGGGFTISCSTSSLQINAERFQTYSDFFGPREVLLIPPTVPSTYPIPGWSGLPMGSCGQCVMQYTGETRDETTLSLRIGGAGIGANFTLIPAGEARLSDSIVTDVCRLRQRQCCTPLCSIP